MEELKASIEVEDYEVEQCVEDSTKHLNNYMHRKIPFQMRISNTKQHYYNTSKSQIKQNGNMEQSAAFPFYDVLPDGRLAIPPYDHSKCDSKGEHVSSHIVPKSKLLSDEFFSKHNLCLSDVEEQFIYSPENVGNTYVRREKKVVRNAKGKFVKQTDTLEEKSKKSQTIIDQSLELGDLIESIEDTSVLRLDDSDLLALAAKIEDNMESKLPFHLDDCFNLSQISELSENSVADKNDDDVTKIQFFRPFREYWMYHCIFSRVKLKNFQIFVKTLPRTFRWLLDECAHIVEMSTEDLYEEICLIETYHANILTSSENGDKNINADPMLKSQCNLVLSKW